MQWLPSTVSFSSESSCAVLERLGPRDATAPPMGQPASSTCNLPLLSTHASKKLLFPPGPLSMYFCSPTFTGPVVVVGSQLLSTVTTPGLTGAKPQFLRTNDAVPSALNARVPNRPFHVPCAASRNSCFCRAGVAVDCVSPDCLAPLLVLEPLRPLVLLVLLRPVLLLLALRAPPPPHDASRIMPAANATSGVPMTGCIRS